MRFSSLAILLLLAPSLALAANPECMGFDGESWESIDVVNVKMAPGHCPSRMSIEADFFYVTYELKEGPRKLPGKTVCKWTFSSDGIGRLEPGDGVPAAIICTLLHY